MHSNFVTPPDYIETVLILNAPEEQLGILAEMIQHRDQAYNVYFYHDGMNDPEWLNKVSNKADVILDVKITNPMDYFNK